MEYNNGEWAMKGRAWDDPKRIKSPEELIELIKKIGFLPLFENQIPGFSVEEYTSGDYWWSGNDKEDPWEWRKVLAQSKQVIYGKFFQKKACFISLDWFPHLANYRRDGYDFDSLYEDEKASIRSKKIMDCMFEYKELYSHELKAKAGFQKVRGSDKEVYKNYQGVVADLQMQTYLIAKDFRKKISKKGNEYGWDITIYTTPEELFGYDFTTSCYQYDPQESKQRIVEHIHGLYPEMSLSLIEKII